MNVDAALTFLDFVSERHRVWQARQEGKPQPWTDDTVVATRKFTNVFRWLDPGSQFVINHLLCDDPETTLMRCFLYRHTNLPSAWFAAAAEFGGMPDLEHLEDLEDFWLEYAAEGNRVFSGAYMIYPQSAVPGTNKITAIIDLVTRTFITGTRTWHDFRSAPGQQGRFGALRTNRGVADFMSMQILTDFGYGTEFRENDFVIAGPGARKGALALSMPAPDAIEWAYSAVNREGGIRALNRVPSKMDIQNCLCEFSKYVRYESKPSPQKLYAPAHPGVQLTPVLPKHWT